MLTLPESTIQIVTYVFLYLLGLALVWPRTAKRFDEGDYLGLISDVKAQEKYKERFNKYSPKFIAKREKFDLSRKIFIFSMVVVYSIVALTPGLLELLYKLTGFGVDPALQDPKLVPIGAALLVIAAHDLPYVNGGVNFLRDLLYQYAGVPVGIQSTVSSLEGRGFDFDKYRKLDEFKEKKEEFSQVKNSDIEEKVGSVERRWA